jgi:hypothetical protein
VSLKKKNKKKVVIMDFGKVNTLAILGDRDTGKTNLMIYLMRKSDKKRYLLGYPKKIDGFSRINSLLELSMITDSIIGIDELQKIIPFYSKRANDTLLSLLSTMVHHRNTLIFTTCLSQYINKSLDGFIDGFCITRLSDLKVLKNGCKAKRRLEEFSHPSVNLWSVNLKNGEYIELIDNTLGTNGVKKFNNQGIKKDWEKS